MKLKMINNTILTPSPTRLQVTVLLQSSSYPKEDMITYSVSRAEYFTPSQELNPSKHKEYCQHSRLYERILGCRLKRVNLFFTIERVNSLFVEYYCTYLDTLRCNQAEQIVIDCATCHFTNSLAFAQTLTDIIAAMETKDQAFSLLIFKYTMTRTLTRTSCSRNSQHYFN
ncbi:Hypothetical_protein [Hexamita inflata]|uniref:Hypothetical_protein n=1 Tax=Hexamita inflata TaxID=28002 RepID=A0AA86PUP6_9EUKA|nr:Hypothetical protein HINF_LOCUS29017 [Hexamita inflata]